MAVPPCYADLGKSAKDIFNKGYGMFFLLLLFFKQFNSVVLWCNTSVLPSAVDVVDEPEMV